MFYEYKCAECDTVFELKLPVSECAKPQECTDCGKSAPRLYGNHNINMKNWREGMKPFRNETKPWTTKEADRVNAGGSL